MWDICNEFFFLLPKRSNASGMAHAPTTISTRSAGCYGKGGDDEPRDDQPASTTTTTTRSITTATTGNEGFNDRSTRTYGNNDNNDEVRGDQR